MAGCRSRWTPRGSTRWSTRRSTTSPTSSPRWCSNVVVLVEDEPPEGEPDDLLGLYDGVALTERDSIDRRPAAGPDLHLPRATARLRASPRRSWSRRSASPSSTRSRTTSASTTSGCTTSATPESRTDAGSATDGPSSAGAPRPCSAGRTRPGTTAGSCRCSGVRARDSSRCWRQNSSARSSSSMNRLSVRPIERGDVQHQVDVLLAGRLARPRSARRPSRPAAGARASRTGRTGSWPAGSPPRAPAPGAAPRGAARGSAAWKPTYDATGTPSTSTRTGLLRAARFGRARWSTPVMTPRAPSCVGEVGRRGEPDDLAVVLDLGAPGVRATRHDAQARGRTVSSTSLCRRSQRRRRGQHRRRRPSRRAPRRAGAPGAPHPDRDGRLAVQQRVGDQLGDPELGALGELGAADVRQVSTTQRRASCTPRGPGSRVRAGRFSGTGNSRKSRWCLGTGASTPANGN